MEWAHKDYRWIPTLSLWAVSLYIFLNNRNKQARTICEIISPVWPLVVWVVFATHDNRLCVYTVEGLIAAYYLFVAERIDKKGILLLAIGIGACLLSRYTIVFWVPLCVLLYFIAGRRKDAIIICATIVLLITMFYWLPFLRRDSSIFLSGYAYHTKATYYEWLRDLKVFNGGVYLFNGLGFSCFAMKWLPGDEGYKLMLYKNIQIAVCLLTVAGLAWHYVRKRAVYPLPIYLLFSFKVYLTVFYSFIQLPYKYLYFVPIIISASLLGRAFKENTMTDTK